MNCQVWYPTPSNYLTLTNSPFPSVSYVEIDGQWYTCHFKCFSSMFALYSTEQYFYTQNILNIFHFPPKYPQHISLPSFLQADAACRDPKPDPICQYPEYLSIMVFNIPDSYQKIQWKWKNKRLKAATRKWELLKICKWELQWLNYI